MSVVCGPGQALSNLCLDLELDGEKRIIFENTQTARQNNISLYDVDISFGKC